LRRIEWIVYAKRPFAGPEQVLAYLSRYTHRIAISNRRLVALDDSQVAFTWRDYARGRAQKIMRLDAHEFLRRFLYSQRRAFHRHRNTQRCQTSPVSPSIPITGEPAARGPVQSDFYEVPIDRRSCQNPILCDPRRNLQIKPYPMRPSQKPSDSNTCG
jgi:hypothetical protein